MKRTNIGALITAGTIAVGAPVTVTAPIAHADRLSESTIKSECKEVGGTYDTRTTPKGEKVSTCSYKSDGQYVFDVYRNGVYQGTV